MSYRLPKIRLHFDILINVSIYKFKGEIMKKIVCELCGSNELIKEGDYFVCKYCGTRYSLEDARKMMVEVEGTVNVKVDETEKINNYLDMAKSAFKGTNMADAINYCDKVLEIDTKNVEAWKIKSESLANNSSLQDLKFSQAIQAAINCINNAPEEKKEELATELFYTMKHVFVFLLGKAYQTGIVQSQKYINILMIQWNNMLVEIPNIPERIYEEQITECHNLCVNSKKAFSPSKRLVYSAYLNFNNNQPYDEMFKENLGRK